LNRVKNQVHIWNEGKGKGRRKSRAQQDEKRFRQTFPEALKENLAGGGFRGEKKGFEKIAEERGKK